MKTQPCGAGVMEGRLRKAERFMDSAGTIHELAETDEDAADAYVTLCVHAGIAASDVICCTSLGRHAQGESHSAAVELLKDADVDASRHLRALLGLKTNPGTVTCP